ncbi:2029_t:CDS:2 [Entrophospora sp. SA101]|nr:2029_t:CDS:2 [Entrophospora sp. SA101]CAJ0843406.1 8967_t:CDS:2 [Entrophospora sp. SA101]
MASLISQNLFALLGEDEDAEKAEKTSETATTPQNETVLVQKQIDRSRASKKEARIKHDYPQRGGFKNSAPRGNDDNRSDYPSRSSRGARPGERGRGGRRDGGGRGGREYDRHSASGRYDSEKKENQGWGSNNADWEDKKNKTNNNVQIDNNVNNNGFSSNWESGNNGNTADDSNAWNSGNAESQEQTNNWGANDESGSGKVEDQPWEIKESTGEADDAKGENIGDDEAAAKPIEPEEIVKTLEEYLSEKAQKTLDISLPEARKPNEGVDDSQWKDAVPLEKKEEEDILFSGKEQSFKTKSKNKKSKNYLEIKPTFDKPGGGGGGERSYDDHNNRRRGGDGGGSRNKYVNIDDQRAFPSLGNPVQL